MSADGISDEVVVPEAPEVLEASKVESPLPPDGQDALQEEDDGVADPVPESDPASLLDRQLHQLAVVGNAH